MTLPTEIYDKTSFITQGCDWNSSIYGLICPEKLNPFICKDLVGCKTKSVQGKTSQKKTQNMDFVKKGGATPKSIFFGF